MVGDIKYKLECPDGDGKKNPGFAFSIEVASAQFGDPNEILNFLTGNPMHVIMRDRQRSTSSTFTTRFSDCEIIVRLEEGAEDKKIRLFKVPVIAFRRDVKEISNLLDLRGEEYVNVELSPRQLSLGVDDDKKPGKDKDGSAPGARKPRGRPKGSAKG